MERTDILMIHGRSPREMTKKLLREADAASMIPSEETLIGIKPNLLGPIPASEGATTHPEVTAGIIEYLQEEGFKRIVMLESSWVGDRTADSLLVTGFDRLAEQYGVPFWDLQEDRAVEIDCAGQTLHICERAARVEFLINVPVLKGHCQTKMTCALKNMKGLLPASEKRRFHRMGLHEPIGRLSAGIRQDLIVVDSICPDLTFEDGGSPVELNRVFLALDPVLCDAVGAKMLGLKTSDVPYIEIAEQCGVGCSNPDRAVIRVIGEKEERQGSVMLPESMVSERLRMLEIAENVDAVDTCSACYAAVMPVLAELDAEGRLGELPDRICMGQRFRGQTGDYGIGNCTKGFVRSLPGCPPTREAVEEWLRKLL